MAPADSIRVEVAFALPARQKLVSVQVPDGATVSLAISQSRIGTFFPGVDVDSCEVAIWGKPAARNQALREGDRVEILRPLEIDPREARRRLAEAGRVMGGPAEESD